MIDLEKIQQQLIDHEGLLLNAYVCPAGYITIGVGRNLDGRGITKTEAMMLLENDIKECITDLQNVIPMFESFTEQRQLALIDMRFNLGQNGFCSFKKMIEALKQRCYVVAAGEMLESKWATQVGQRAQTLAVMMRGGK